MPESFVGRAGLLVAGVFVLAIFVQLVTGGDDRPQRDAASVELCREFRDVLVDADAGVLTEGELRSRLQEIDQRRSSAELHGQLRAVLAAVTSGDADEVGAAADRLARSCGRL